MTQALSRADVETMRIGSRHEADAVMLARTSGITTFDGMNGVIADPWFVGTMGKGLSGLLLVESPVAFRRRRIFTEAEPLRRARMPSRVAGEAASR
jgi:hypothetical protein